MAADKEIVFESNRGIIFERTLFKNGRVRLAVRAKDDNELIKDYRYINAKGLQSPFLNWDNLNCCNGWVHDEAYLHTAVQRGKKLYAGIDFSIAKKDAFPGRPLPAGFYTEGEVSEQIRLLRDGLPMGCILGIERPDSDLHYSVTRFIYICKAGAIRDYINIDDVLSAYERFGIILGESHVNRITDLCAIPISSFAGDSHMDYGNPNSAAELIATGLLLGYPIETTASMFKKPKK